MTSEGNSAAPPTAPPLAFACLSCRRPFPDRGFPHQCPACGGLFDFSESLPLPGDGDFFEAQTGLPSFRRTISLPPDPNWVSLGEGGTPLLPVVFEGRTIHFKCEFSNPTGSFKDRGSAVLVNAVRAAGVTEAVEDSSGNAGASFAAYAARCGIRAKVFVPLTASPLKLAQMEAYGAEIVRVPGPRSNTSQAVLRAVEGGAVYASHAHLPHVLIGMATLAFELFANLGQAPGSVVVPVGQGTLLLGLSRGFRALRAAGRIQEVPRLIGVQARSCAPIWAVAHAGRSSPAAPAAVLAPALSGAAGLSWVGEGETIAEGIRIRNPLRGDEVLAAVETSGGWMHATEEGEISVGRLHLARLGLWVEPTSAVVWSALRSGGDRWREPVVAVLTGSGYKHPG